MGSEKDENEGLDEGMLEESDKNAEAPFFLFCSSNLIFSSCATPSPLCGIFFCFGFLLGLPPPPPPPIPPPKSPPPPPPLLLPLHLLFCSSCPIPLQCHENVFITRNCQTNPNAEVSGRDPNLNQRIKREKKNTPIAKSKGITKNPSKIYLKSLHLRKSRLAKTYIGTTPITQPNFQQRL